MPNGLLSPDSDNYSQPPPISLLRGSQLRDRPHSPRHPNLVHCAKIENSTTGTYVKKSRQQDVIPSNNYPSLFRRLGAWLYDSLIIIAVLMLAGGVSVALTAGLSSLGIINTSGYLDISDYMSRHPSASILYSSYLVTVAISFFTYFWCQAGQTLGMRAWKLRLQNSDGSPIRPTQALIRLATSAFGLGNLLAPFSTRKQSFQDIMAECEMIVLDKAI